MITDKVNNKPRGYAFIEYSHTRHMKDAYKQVDGRKLDDRRVLVDVECGRTVPNWRPRRLGGGLGSTRVGGDEVNMKYSGREPQQLTSGGPSNSEEPKAREARHVDSFGLGLYAGVIVHQESSLRMGLNYIVAAVSLFDDYTNDLLYLREGCANQLGTNYEYIRPGAVPDSKAIPGFT